MPYFPALELQEAFTTAATARWPAWETVASSNNVNGRLRSFEAKQGRNSDLDRDLAGTATFVVDARDRKLDPANTASPHYPHVTPNRPIRLAVGYVAEVLRDYPGHYWRLDEYSRLPWFRDDFDDAAIAVKQPIPGGPTNWAGPGILWSGHAAGFDAASSQWLITPNMSLWESGDATYEAWITTSSSTGVARWVLSEGNSASPNGFSGIRLDPSGYPQVLCANDAGTTFGVTGPNVVTDGVRHHIVATLHAGLVRFFVDSTQVGTVSVSGTFTQNQSAIGACARNTVADFFDGTIQHVAVYGYALPGDRITAHYGAGWFGVGGYVFSGFVDAHNVSYRGANDAVATIPATDRFKLLARQKLTGTVARPQENTHTRIAEVLSQAGLEFQYDSTAGAAIMQAEDVSGSTVLETVLSAVDTEGPAARLFVDKDGCLKFVSRRANNEDPPYTTAQFTFSDSGDPGVIPYSSIEFENSDTLLFNDAEIDHPTFGVASVVDTAARDEYGLLTYERTVRDAAPAAQHATAEAVVAQYKDPKTRVLSVTVPTSRESVNGFNSLIGPVLAVQLGMRVIVQRTAPPGGGDPISQECYVVSQSHSCDASTRQWTTTFGFAAAADVSSYAQFDAGQFDVDAFGY